MEHTMDTERAASELKIIRQLMERPIRYSTMSGLAGIWAGSMALVGVALDYAVSTCYGRDPYDKAMWINLLVWVGVLVAALAGVWTLTRRRERRQGMPAWSSIKTRILRTIAPPFVAGVGLTLVIVFRWHFGVGANHWDLIPTTWMLFYGLALWQAGEFSPREVRLLGAAFIVAGLVASAVPILYVSPYLVLGVTFGGFHIAYGAVVWMRYGG
jgi:hypothetical protein